MIKKDKEKLVFEQITKIIEHEISEKEIELKDLKKKLLDHKKKLIMQCTADACGSNKGCGALFSIGDAIYIRTHWYEGPHGCTDGDIWHVGDGEVICPHCNAKTRLYDRPELNKKEYLFKNVIEAH